MKKIIITIFLILFSLTLVACKPSQDEMVEKGYEISKLFVNDILKSPYSAKYPDASVPIKCSIEKDGSYVFLSYVDSQNSYGAMLRSHYYIVLEPQDEQGKKWNCTWLSMWTQADQSDIKIFINTQK